MLEHYLRRYAENRILQAEKLLLKGNLLIREATKDLRTISPKRTPKSPKLPTPPQDQKRSKWGWLVKAMLTMLTI